MLVFDSVTNVVLSAAVDGGKLMSYFNLPWFAWGSAEMRLGDTAEYDTRVRVTSPYDRLATAIVKLFVHYNVRSITNVRFLRARRYSSAIFAVVACPFVCLSVCHKPVLYQNG